MAEWLSLDATEPFPDGLFRIPIRDAVFSEMPEWSDVALRSLLALIHLSYHYDPEEGNWVLPERSFPRSRIQEAAGLSSQGTRDGLAELEAGGWIAIDRTGRSHRHRLLLEVPDRRYTYLPTALLEKIGAFGSATELRVVLAVLRGTWGWTEPVADPQGGSHTVHTRWTQASTSSLADATGRSTAAVKQAAKALQGRWIERVRPGNGAYQYRFLPEAIGDGSGPRSSVSPENAKHVPPHRQNSDPPSYKEKKESFSHRHTRDTGKSGRTREPDQNRGSRAVPPDENRTRNTTRGGRRQATSPPPSRNSQQKPPDLSEFSPEQQDLGQILANVGVWPGRIIEVLTRYSASRIRANFQLFRQRNNNRGDIHSPGAWLYKAITQGYALPSSSQAPNEPDGSSNRSSLPSLSHKHIVSEAEKDACVASGIAEECFHQCPPDQEGPRYMYFDPEIGGPRKRV
jgi:hypothetical protein